MKKLIIIGGGFAGSLIAKNLENEFETTLIDTKDYFEFTPGVLRTIVDPSNLKKIQIMHEHYLKSTKFIRGSVKKIEEDHIILEDKTKIDFDYLVLATGSRYSLPIKQDNVISSARAKTIRDSYRKLNQAKTIIIIGGGFVGVEMAAEIATNYKNKEIKVVDRDDKLMSRANEKTSKHAEEFLLKRGVKIIFNEKIIKMNKGTFTTESGKKLKADIAFMCNGMSPNTEFIKNSFPNKLDERNFVKVNQYLQLEKFKYIFAAGDIVSIKEEKLAQNAQNHAHIIIDNLRNLEDNSPLKKYETGKRLMVISLGKYDGILNYKKLFLTGIIPGIFKSIIQWDFMLNYRKPI